MKFKIPLLQTNNIAICVTEKQPCSRTRELESCLCFYDFKNELRKCDREIQNEH